VTKFGMFALITAVLAACQSGSGTGSLNAHYAQTGNCSYTYDYSNTDTGICLGRQWH
jgi:hypothetical protein